MKKISILIFVLASAPVLASCLLKKSGNYEKDDKFPYLEIWNKEDQKTTDPERWIYVTVGHDLKKLPNPELILPKYRLLGWTTDTGRTTTGDKKVSEIAAKIYPDKKIYIAVYKNKLAADHKPMPVPESVQVYEAEPQKTVYLSWTKEKGLYPQTGQLMGIAGYTESCLNTGKNIKKLTNITPDFKKQVPAPTECSTKAVNEACNNGKGYCGYQVINNKRAITCIPKISKKTA